MSEENVKRLRAFYADMGRGTFNTAGDLISDDIVYEPVGDGHEAYVGRDAFGGQFREFLGQWNDFRIEGLEFEDLGDAVLVTERQSGTGRASGIEVEMTFFAVWTFRDGVVIRARWDTDRASAIKNLGT